jgi:hypothetical protein
MSKKRSPHLLVKQAGWQVEEEVSRRSERVKTMMPAMYKQNQIPNPVKGNKHKKNAPGPL